MESKFFPMLLKKETAQQKIYHYSLRTNNNKIIDVKTEINYLTSKQKKFSQVLSRPFNSIQAITVVNGVKKLAKDKSRSILQLDSLQVKQQKIQQSLKINEFKINKLKDCIHEIEFKENEKKLNLAEDELISLAASRTEYSPVISPETKSCQIPLIQPTEVSGVRSLSADMLLSKGISHYDNISSQSHGFVSDMSMQGALKLNENQSIEVHMQAVETQSCSVSLKAVSTVNFDNFCTINILKEHQGSLKRKIEKEGLDVTDFSLEQQLIKGIK